MSRLSILCGAALLLSGCAVGPDFHRPAAPPVHALTPAPIPATLGAGPDREAVAAGAEVPRDWWLGFGSETLDGAVARALAANADLDAARAALRVAEEQARAQRGALLPTLGADASIARQRSADALSPTLDSGQNPYTLRTAQLSIGYALDLFGGQRRALESSLALVEYQRFEAEAARTTVVANLVVALMRAAALRGEVDAAARTVALQERIVTLARRQRELGAASTAAVIAQESALALDRGALAPLQKSLAQTRDLVTALEGGYPDGRTEPALDLDTLALPPVPLALPSRLVEMRPDVRAAEALCHSASASIGVATAAMLPDVTLSANTGRLSEQAGSLFAAGNRFYGAAGDLAQPLFAGGALLHHRRAAVAAYEQSLAQYRSTVIGAFQNVADVLQALEADAAALEAARSAESTAQRTWELVQRQVGAGDASHLTDMQAEIAYLSARAARLDVQATRFGDVVALYQALGGSWSEPAAPGR